MMLSKNYKDVFACAIGGAFAWFDYTLYGIFASTLAQQFFPQDSPHLSQLLVYIIFALGFISRPIGGIVCGHFADMIGRKKILVLSMCLMTFSTFMIGLIPTYNAIGIYAPMLLVIARLLQGIAIGGEFSMVYLVEQAPAEKRGIYGSWSDFGSPLGVLFGLIMATVLSNKLSVQDFDCFGWRIPFLISLLAGILGIYLRLKLSETHYFKNNEEKNTHTKETIPIVDVIKNYKLITLNAALINAFGGVSFYLLLTFLHNYLKTHTNVSQHNAYLFTSLANLGMLLMIPIGGYISDFITRKKTMCFSIIVAVSVSWPMLYTLEHNFMHYHIILQVIFGGAIGLFFGGRAAFFAEAFPTKIRCSAISLAFGISHSLFAGTTPFVAEYIIYKTSVIQCLTVILVFFGILSIIALHSIFDRTGKELR